jgi:DivIVA domain-containing protein
MPLTPEDVANKQFTSTRLKPGYDETEVDEFLDEVEAELTRLYRENDELRSRLASAGRQPSDSGGAPAAAAAPAAPDPAVLRENEELRSKLQSAQRQLAEAQERGRAAAATSQQAAPPPPPPAAPAQQAAAAPSETATGILAMAQRTADEHIAEARTQADRIIGEARTRAEQLKREAEDKHRQTIGSLETERSGLERKVEQLRAFEREYRGRLKSYHQGQLRELEGKGTEAPSGGSGGGSSPQQPQGAPASQGAPQGGSPFSAGSPVSGSDGPGGPPQQPGSGFSLDEGSDQR